MQCDDSSSVIHLLLHFLIGKKQEREKKKKKGNMFQLQTNVRERFTINKEPAKREALSTSKGVKFIPNEITLVGEHISISKGNTMQIRDQEKYWNSSVVSQAATAIKVELKKHIHPLS